jgi:hypothetical protein
MLLGAVTVLVVVATGAAGAASEPPAAGPKDPTTRAMEKALRTALGADAVVTVRRAAGSSEDELLTWAVGERANLLGIVTWSDEQRRATLRFVHPSEGRWADREIKFDASDVPTERGRTVGFAFASMVPDDAIPPRAAAPPAPAAPAPPAPERPIVPPPTSPRRAPDRWSLEAGATAASGINGFGGGFGGLAALRYRIAPSLAIRVAFTAREGDVSPASATARTYLGGAGIAWQTWVGAPQRFGVGARADALLLAHEMVHLSADDTAPTHLTRVLPAGDLALEGSWRFVEQAGLFVSFGTEVAFGRTDVYVRDRLVAELAALRIFGEAGVRVSF